MADDESVDSWIALLDDAGDKAGEELRRRAYLDSLRAQPQVLSVPACKRPRQATLGGMEASSSRMVAAWQLDYESTAAAAATADVGLPQPQPLPQPQLQPQLQPQPQPQPDAAAMPTLDYTIMYRSPRGQLEGYIAVQAGLLVKSALHVGKCFKIGITTDPYHRLRNPAYGYYRHEFAYNMSVLCRATKAEAARLEVFLIKHMQERTAQGLCRNKHEGGGGIARDALVVYVYIVFFRYVV
jgi:hypothetical protein